MKISKSGKLILLGVVSLALLWSQSVLAIGQLSKPIVVNNVLRGQAIPETLTLFNSDKEVRDFGLLASGDIAEWSAFYLPEDLATAVTKISVPAEGTAKAAVVITVPDDTPNGRYSGVLSVTYAPESTGAMEDKSTSVTQNIGRSVTITVTDKEIMKLETAVIPLTYQLAINEPLQIKLNYRNLGNVSVKPQAQLKIFSDQKNVANAIFPYPEQEAIKPLTSKSLQVEWPTSGLTDGRYQAEVTILVNGEAQYTDSFRFHLGVVKVLGASIFSNWGDSGFINTLLITVIGLLILAVLIFIAVKLWQNSKQAKRRAKPRLKKSLAARTKQQSINQGLGFATNVGKEEKEAGATSPQSKSSRRPSW
ncbi:MAG: hypothetical protein V1712_00175 [Patescibacteria group bacterium]